MADQRDPFLFMLPPEEMQLSKVVDGNYDRLHIQVIEKIRLWIMRGYLQEGQVLPSERKLAAMFDVSRMPVANALKILEFLGAVQFISGKGFCVKKIDLPQLVKFIGFLVLTPDDGQAAVFETRKVIEPQSAQLAAQRHMAEDIIEIESAIMEMEYRLARGDDVSDASMKFHSALATASHNEILITINDFLFETFKVTRQATLRDKTHQTKALEYHKKILDAIKAHNGDLAQSLMAEHLASGF